MERSKSIEPSWWKRKKKYNRHYKFVMNVARKLNAIINATECKSWEILFTLRNITNIRNMGNWTNHLNDQESMWPFHQKKEGVNPFGDNVRGHYLGWRTCWYRMALENNKYAWRFNVGAGLMELGVTRNFRTSRQRNRVVKDLYTKINKQTWYHNFPIFWLYRCLNSR